MSLLRFFAINTSPLPRSHTMLLHCDLSALSLIWFNTLIFVAEQNRSKVHGTLLPHCKFLPRYLIDSLYPIPSYAINLLSHGFVTVLCCAVLCCAVALFQVPFFLAASRIYDQLFNFWVSLNFAGIVCFVLIMPPLLYSFITYIILCFTLMFVLFCA